jgi:hypothetical protein
MNSLARTLGSWVRMFVVYMRLFCVCVTLCVGSGLATGVGFWRGSQKEMNRYDDTDLDGRITEK